LLDVRNDLGLLCEEYDPLAKRQLGNFPQAFTHVALISAARILADDKYASPKQSGSRFSGGDETPD